MERKAVKRRFLSLMLALCMVLATLPVTPAMAATATTVSSETDLITAVANGGTVKLGGDITLTDILNVTNDVTLDLNDKTLTGAGETAIAVKSGGNLTITGSATGSIIGSTGGTGGTAITVDGGSLNVSSGNVIGGKGGIGHYMALSYGGNGGNGLYITGGTVTISGGEITGGNGDTARVDYDVVGGVGGMGGSALYVAGGTVIIDGSGTIRGGDGGNNNPGQFPPQYRR